MGGLAILVMGCNRGRGPGRRGTGGLRLLRLLRLHSMQPAPLRFELSRYALKPARRFLCLAGAVCMQAFHVAAQVGSAGLLRRPALLPAMLHASNVRPARDWATQHVDYSLKQRWERRTRGLPFVQAQACAHSVHTWAAGRLQWRAC